MTQPHLFAELDFNAKNVRKWADEQVAKEPTIEVQRYQRKQWRLMTVKNTVRMVLADVVGNIHAMSLCQYDKNELLQECLAYIMDGVQKPVNSMTIRELLEEIVGETTENFEIADMDDFVRSGIATGDF